MNLERRILTLRVRTLRVLRIHNRYRKGKKSSWHQCKAEMHQGPSWAAAPGAVTLWAFTAWPVAPSCSPWVSLPCPCASHPAPPLCPGFVVTACEHPLLVGHICLPLSSVLCQLQAASPAPAASLHCSMPLVIDELEAELASFKIYEI